METNHKAPQLLQTSWYFNYEGNDIFYFEYAIYGLLHEKIVILLN